MYKATLEIICLGSKVIESFELGLSSLSFEAENLSSALDVCEHFSKLERSLNNFAALQKITKIQESLYDIGNKIQPRVEEAIQKDVDLTQNRAGLRGEAELRDEAGLRDEVWQLGEADQRVEAGHRGDDGHGQEPGGGDRMDQEQGSEAGGGVRPEVEAIVNRESKQMSGQPKKKQILKKFTKSLEKCDSLHKCPHCPKEYENFKCLVRHSNKKHPEEQKLTFKTNSNRDFIICLLQEKKKQRICRKSVEKSRITRHIKSCHDEEKPGSAQEFCGFQTIDDGETWTVAWKKMGSEDPPAEEYIDKAGDNGEDEMNNNAGTKDVEGGQIMSNDGNNDLQSSPSFHGFPSQENNKNNGLSNLISQLSPASEEHFETANYKIFKIQNAFQSPGGSFEDKMENSHEKISDFVPRNPDLSISDITINIEENGDYEIIESPTLSESFGALPESSSQSEYSDESTLISGGETITVDHLHYTKSAPSYAVHNQKIDTFSDVESDEDINDNEEEDSGDDNQDNDECADDGGDSSDLDESSDEDATDEEDSPDEAELAESEFTQTRHERRKILDAVISLEKLPENKKFYSGFVDWWKNIGANNVTKNKDTSTLRMTTNYIFLNDDSYLNYQSSKNPEFNMDRLVAFGSEEYLALPSPMSWLAEVGGKSGRLMPSRRKEMLKCFQRLKMYLVYLLNEGNSFQGDKILMKDAVERHLEDIDKELKQKKLNKQFDKLYKQQKKRKERMEEIVQPSASDSIQNSVKTWFFSEEAQRLEVEAMTIYNQAMALKTITKAKFEQFCKWVFFEFMLFDKSRVGILENLKNEDYHLKRSAWIPQEMSDLAYKRLPKDWLLYSPPTADAEPTSYEIDLVGDELMNKNQEGQTVIMNDRVFQLCEKMQDLKMIVFGEIKLEDFFFVRYDGKPLPKLQNYPSANSLLHVFGCVTGIPKFTFKSLRKSAEGVIQSSGDLAETTKQLNSHSQKVGEETYDKLRGSRRNIFLHNLSKNEGCNTLRNITVDDEERRRRQERDENAKKELISKANKYLDSQKNVASFDFRPTAVNQDDVSLLRSVFGANIEGMLVKRYNVKVAPITLFTALDWKESFYKLVDSLDGPNGDALRELEEKVFRNTIEHVIKKHKIKKWTSSKIQNEWADIAIRLVAIYPLSICY